jgi:hypothetical protein
MDARNYMTIKQAAAKYPAFTEGSLRWLWFNADRNGFSSCVRKVGKKVLIVDELFCQWLESGSAVK